MTTAAKIIGIVQVKGRAGRAGRAAVSTNLVWGLYKIGKTVLINCSLYQGTAASRFSVRERTGRSGNLLADKGPSQ